MATTTTVARHDGTMPKRGDLAIYVKTQRDYLIGEPTRERTVVTLGTITSVSRTGQVLAAVWPFSNDEAHRRPMPTKNLYGGAIHTVPAALIDLDGVLSEYAAHTWPNHDTQIMPYADTEEARAVISRHRI